MSSLTQQLGVPGAGREQTTLTGSPEIASVAAAGASTWSTGTTRHLVVPTTVTQHQPALPNACHLPGHTNQKCSGVFRTGEMLQRWL